MSALSLESCKQCLYDMKTIFWLFQSDRLKLVPHLPFTQLCDLGQIISHLCTTFVLRFKMGQNIEGWNV